MPDLPRTDETPAHLVPGGRFDRRLVLSDRDWIAISLTAATWTQIDMTGIGAQGLSDSYLRVLDAQANLLFIDDDSGPDLDARLQFTLPQTGTYFIFAGAFADDAEGDYLITAKTIAAPRIAPALTWGARQADSRVTVSFAAPGTVLDGFTAEGFTAYERAQIIVALDWIAAVAALDFVVTEALETDLRLLLDLDELRGRYLNPPEIDNSGVGVFDGTALNRKPSGDPTPGGRVFHYLTRVTAWFGTGTSA